MSGSGSGSGRLEVGGKRWNVWLEGGGCRRRGVGGIKRMKVPNWRAKFFTNNGSSLEFIALILGLLNRPLQDSLPQYQ